MNVDDLIGALRATEGDDPELAEVTRLRVQRSLETRVRVRHPLVGVLTAAGILFGGTVSWALATGSVARLWAPAIVAPSAPRQVAPGTAVAPTSRAATPSVAVAIVATPIAPAPSVAVPAAGQMPIAPPSAVAPSPAAPSAAGAGVTPAPIAPRRTAPAAIAAVPGSALPPEIAPMPSPRAPAAASTGDALYHRAHELHFHGGDLAATLAAWDAYLAADPAGLFAVDARYNRALVLVRLGRYAEARAQLEPFAHGAVEPTGYHQAEAEQLVERLAHAR